MLAIFKVFIAAVVGVIGFQLINLPMPWLLGPIFTVMLSQLTIKTSWDWPSGIRNAGLIVLGAAVGETFTTDIFKGFGQYSLYMIVINIVLILFCLLLAIMTEKITKMNLLTLLIASVPGGLTQSVMFAEEHKGIDIGTVTYFQVIRVLMIVSVVPFIVSGQLIPAAHDVMNFTWGRFIIYIVIACAAVPIGKMFKLPVAYFLSPILVGIVFNITGYAPPVMPEILLHAAQLALGAYIGLLLKPEMIRLPRKLMVCGIVSSLLLIAFSYVGSYLLAYMLSIDHMTSFLSMAPGGMDQMSLIAATMKADAALVTLFQLFRLLFIYFIVFPMLKWYTSRSGISLSPHK